MTQHPSAHDALLYRIESALNRATGLNRSIKTLLTGGIYPYDWMSQVEEVQGLLTRAVMDISQLRSELQQEGEANAPRLLARSPQ